jgi:GNAT superfamily N-acetyltransferase
MARCPALVRDAVLEDAEALVSIWADFVPESERGGRDEPTVESVQRALLRLDTDPSERLVVAQVDGQAVGVAHLRRAPISPIHEEDAVHVSHVHVLTGYRRRGIGQQLIEHAADWAEEKDSKHIVSVVAASARESNRFMARLGLGQVAVVRAGTVAALRAKLAPAAGKPLSTNIVAARRLMRRRRATTSV